MQCGQQCGVVIEVGSCVEGLPAGGEIEPGSGEKDRHQGSAKQYCECKAVLRV